MFGLEIEPQSYAKRIHFAKSMHPLCALVHAESKYVHSNAVLDTRDERTEKKKHRGQNTTEQPLKLHATSTEEANAADSIGMDRSFAQKQ